MNSIPPKVLSQFVEAGGARVHYVHAGTGPPLLLIHGLVGSISNWQGNLGALAQERSVYAIDLLNAGKSQRVRGIDGGLEATADRVAATMEALGLDSADVAGHSHGGAVAMMLAARHPERVHGLMLFAPVNPFCPRAGRMVRLYSGVPGRWLVRCAPFVLRKIQRIAVARMYGDPARIPKNCVREYIEGLRVRGTMDHILAIVRAWFDDLAKLEEALPRIADIPTLLVWGDRDRAVSVVSGETLLEKFHTAKLVVVAGGGHVVFEEMPEESNRIMLDWLCSDSETGGRSRVRVATRV